MAIVDFGCGGGALLEVLPAARKIGIEPNAAAAALAVSRGIHVVPMSDDLDDDSVDLAISNHALEHVLHPVAELQQLRRILKVGAHLVIIVPVDDWRAQDNGRANDPNHHLYTWTPLLLGNLLSAAGFAVERVELIHRAWPPAHQFLWRILPPSAFDVLAGLAARVQRRRQLIAVARKDIS
jgi:SAM-dependent methyltransferase